MSNPSLKDWQEASTPDPRTAALRLNENWKRAKGGVSGPIDVIDMFSGCGGMSTGFLSVNGEVPSFRLVGAVDIDNPNAQGSCACGDSFH